LPTRTGITLDPRKLPIQARSVASVDAILEATVQVLLQVGKERLTTTRAPELASPSEPCTNISPTRALFCKRYCAVISTVSAMPWNSSANSRGMNLCEAW
jgi:hypothetical protein